MKVPSYGVSSYGYDITISYKIKKPISGILDPLDPTAASWQTIDVVGESFLLHPGEFMLGVSNEHFEIPENVVGYCFGKSTYARCGLISFMTPLEPGWNGFLTLEFLNASKLPIRIYTNAGISQIVFERGETPAALYNGAYQNQLNVPTHAMM